MTKLLNVLIVEDHPITSEAYTKAFERIQDAESNNFAFKISTASDLLNAERLLKRESYNIVFLDIHLPENNSKLFISGEDVGQYLRKHNDQTKIIISTTYDDGHRIINIFQNINPEGFVVKRELKSKSLVQGILDVIEGSTFYSKTPQKILRANTVYNGVLDEKDRKILYELSQGAKMSDLPNLVSMSLGGIERRKKRLKEIFHVNNNDDRQLLLNARDKGFL